MGNRTTEKANIQALNIPSVTNAEMNTMLQNYLADNLQFREDVAVVQNSSLSSITVDFTGKDRVDLTRTGGDLDITLSGLDDGDRKFLLITKTAGTIVTFVVADDITPFTTNITNASEVLYEILRKGSNYYAYAYFENVVAASEVETYEGNINHKVVTPVRLRQKDGGLVTKVVEIGDWDMDADQWKLVNHGISNYKNIRSVDVVIRDDNDTIYYLLNGFTGLLSSSTDGSVNGILALSIRLARVTGGAFDNTEFDSTSYNRGWITIRYDY